MIKVKENLKIGLFGTRAKYIETAIKEFKFQYQILDDISKIDNTFNLALGSGVYDILKKEILNIPKYGIYGIHESLLPEGKGHAPLHWTILSGKKILTFTLFKMAEKIDTGSLVCHYNKVIDPLDTIYELERKRIEGIKKCSHIFFEELSQGIVVLREQTGMSTYNPKRTKESSMLDANKPLIELWDQIRVCHNEEYPAYFEHNGKKIYLRHDVV